MFQVTIFKSDGSAETTTVYHDDNVSILEGGVLEVHRQQEGGRMLLAPQAWTRAEIQEKRGH